MVARSLGVTLREFLGDDPKPGEPRYDDTERNLWRALQLFEADLCPGCGQPHTKSLYDRDNDTHPTYGAGFVECLGCVELLRQQEEQRLIDAAKQHSMSQPFKDRPHLAPHLMTGHRHWRAWEQPVSDDTTPPH